MAGRLPILLVLLAGVLGVQTLRAADLPAVTKGVAWLLASVAADGSQPAADSIGTPMQARSESAATLKRLASLPANLVQAIAAEQDDNTEYLARKAVGLQLAGQAAVAELAGLATRQNADGGYGAAAGFASNPLDTSWTMLAMASSATPDSARLASAARYLLSVQGSGGGFGMTRDAQSTYVTSLAMLSLQAVAATPELSNALTLASNWLRAKQGADGGWGSAADTAYAYLALIGSVSDSALQSAAQASLLQQQGSDGSWSGDPYVTALALRALSTQPRPLPTKGNVTLQVVDAESGQPLAGALATLQGSVIAPALTDATGRAAFKDIDANSYTVVVTAAGYASASTGFTLAAGTTVNAGLFKLSVAPSTGMVKGVVRDAASGTPISDALVTVTGSANASTTSAADGSYQLSGLAPGALSITVAKNGYKPVAAAGSVTAGGVLAFSPLLAVSTAAPGQPPEQPADPALPGSLTGQVVDATSGAALAGATVRLSAALAATSGADGRFLLSGIPAGSYALQVQKSGYVSRTGSILVAANSRTDIQSVPLAKEQTSVVVQGKVTDLRSGKALADVRVSVVGGSLEARSDSSGNYRIEGMATGTATLRFAATGYAGETVLAEFPAVGSYRVDMALSLDNGSNPTLSQLAADRDSYGAYEPVDFRMTVDNQADQAIADAQVDLTVFDGEGRAINQQQVMLTDAQGVAQALIPVPANSQVNVGAKWNTVAYAPGQYQAKARLFRTEANGGKTVLAERTMGFTVEASRKLLRLSATPMPAFTVIDANVQISVKVEAVNQSNVPLATSFKYTFRTPAGALVQEQEGSLTLQPNETLGSLVLGPFDYHFAASGNYPVELTVTGGETPQALAGGQVNAAPGVRVEAVQQVTPTNVTPDGDKRIRIQLQLKGVEQK